MQRLDAFQEYGGNELIVDSDKKVGQTFVSHHDNLSGIRFSVSNPILGGNRGYRLSILDQNQTALRNLDVNESNLGWQMTFRYDFKPIKDSKEKIYILDIAPLESTTAAKLSDKSFLRIAYTKQDLYKEGTALVNNKPVSGDLTFFTFYQANPATFVKDFTADFKSRIAADRNFAISYLAIMFILIFFLFGRIIGKRRS